jgi:AraC-like DNA-binding protein
MVCGVFRFGNPAAATMLAALPTLLHVPSVERDAGTLLSSAIPLLLQETASRAPGSALTTARLIDILLVYAVRHWLTSSAAGSGGWTAALRDPKISGALAQLHAAPARSWTVAALAATVGMSRSPFAARFAAAMKEPPLRYVTRWRMHLAADLLLNDEGVSVREVAARVGYEAEEAFSRAFKRFFHASPAAFRKRADSSL